MKKLLALVLALVMVAACAVAMADPVTLTYAEVNPLDTIVGQTATAFKTKVEELSGGEVIIDIQANGVLGAEAQVLDGILMGGDTVDISRISAFALTSYGCQKAMLLSIPYTFVSREHFWNFANSELADEFLAEPQTIGLPLRGLCYGEEGFRHFFTNFPVNKIEDLKGKKIRVSDDPVMRGMVEDLGANPTIVSFTELYSALQTGVVDGAEQPTANYKSNAFPEVAPHFILDGHTLGAIQIVITDNGWNKLSAEQQGWIMEAAQYASDFNAELSAKAEAEVLEQLKAEGVSIVEVSNEDKALWAAACQKTIEKNTKSQAALYQQILDMQ
ncbi:MAG: TRAP transporter substrate-binding protein [Clostridiales bacterium]|nr:TRAP transporter substrate-binding protein [Clostridiales bacterium]